MPPRSLPLIAPRALARKPEAFGVVRRCRPRVLCVPIAVAVMLCALPLVSPLVAQRATRCGVSERVKAVAFEGSPAFDGLAMAATTAFYMPNPAQAPWWFCLGLLFAYWGQAAAPARAAAR